jgi:hypothetical protein
VPRLPNDHLSHAARRLFEPEKFRNVQTINIPPPPAIQPALPGRAPARRRAHTRRMSAFTSTSHLARTISSHLLAWSSGVACRLQSTNKAPQDWSPATWQARRGATTPGRCTAPPCHTRRLRGPPDRLATRHSSQSSSVAQSAPPQLATSHRIADHSRRPAAALAADVGAQRSGCVARRRGLQEPGCSALCRGSSRASWRACRLSRAGSPLAARASTLEPVERRCSAR